MGRTPSRIGLLVGPALALAGCGGGGQATVPSSHAPTTIRVTSPAFGDFSDYIGAFLWGFGLHELNKLTMPEGLSKLGLVLPQVQGKSGN